ncbi:MAG: hypothetical protein COA79_14485 [Planctomycetota bacterium]|nr:MAG: hypothetical protein COA79_14485 [Planctomycetota bacterium]
MTKLFISITAIILFVCAYDIYGKSKPIKAEVGKTFSRQKLFFIRIDTDLSSKKSIEAIHADKDQSQNWNSTFLKNIDTQGLAELDGFLDGGWKIVSITPLNTQPRNNVLVLSILMEVQSEVIK